MPSPCRVQTPVPPSTTSHCHGFRKDGSAGAALRAGLQRGGPSPFLSALSYFTHHHGATGEIPLHAGESTFLQTVFQWVLWCPSPAPQLPQCWGLNGVLQSLACFAPCLSHWYTKGLLGDMERLWVGGKGWWRPRGVRLSAPLRGEVSPPCEQGLW